MLILSLFATVVFSLPAATSYTDSSAAVTVGAVVGGSAALLALCRINAALCKSVIEPKKFVPVVEGQHWTSRDWRNGAWPTWKEFYPQTYKSLFGDGIIRRSRFWSEYFEGIPLDELPPTKPEMRTWGAWMKGDELKYKDQSGTNASPVDFKNLPRHVADFKTTLVGKPDKK